MENCKVIMVTSCRGGIGKTTISANLGMALALLSHRTLLLDLDYQGRSLDLVLGCEDSIVFDIDDVLAGRASVGDAAMQDRRCGELLFCAAPGHPERFPEPGAFAELTEKAAEELKLDFIIIDTPGASGEPLRVAAAASESALLAVSHQPSAIRAAEYTAVQLRELGIADRGLIINCFDPAAAAAGQRAGVIDIIDGSRTRIAGIIPHDTSLARAQESGRLACELGRRSRAKAAFDNTARRILGERVPLLAGIKLPSGRKKALSGVLK